MARSLHEQLPWTSSPLVVSAPMGGFAGGALAAAVSKAGGLGQIGAVVDMSELERELTVAKKELGALANEGKTLAVGVGLLPFVLKIENVLPVLEKFKPAVVWLFAAKELDHYVPWARNLRESLPDTSIWVQVGSVSAALTVAQSVQPDALILQGSDAGGHGFERGASIVSLLPEASDVLKANGIDIPLLAAGGIVDARGAAAAFALGASAVVVGTRFLAAKETIVPPGYRELVLAARDGGQSTVRSKLFDNVKGPNIWPGPYDGRSLVTNSYIDHIDGVSIEEIREKHNTAAAGEDAGFGKTNRSNVWVGAGVGLVNNMGNAADIVHEIRQDIKQVLGNAIVKTTVRQS